MAQTGLARAIYPVHTQLEATCCLLSRQAAGRSPIRSSGLTRLGALAANVVAGSRARCIRGDGASVSRRGRELERPVWRLKNGKIAAASRPFSAGETTIVLFRV
jgi:hypothetical protein